MPDGGLAVRNVWACHVVMSRSLKFPQILMTWDLFVVIRRSVKFPQILMSWGLARVYVGFGFLNVST